MSDSSAGRPSKKKSWLARGLVAGALAFLVLHYVSVEELLFALAKISVGDLCMLLALSVLLVLVSVLKWRLFLEHLGIHAKLQTLTGLYLVGYFVNIFTPSFVGGDVVRSIALGPKTNRGHAVAATALERYTGIVAMLGMACCACCFSQAVTREIVLVVIFATIGCVVATWTVFSGGLNSVAKRMGIPEKFVRLFDAIHEGLVLGVQDRRLLGKALVLSVVFHLLTIVNTAAVGIAIGWSEIPWAGLLVVVPLILIIGAVPLSPQGLGIQEGAFVFFLHSVGATTGQALAIAVVLRAKSYLLAVVGGVVWLVNRRQWGNSSEILREKGSEGRDILL